MASPNILKQADSAAREMLAYLIIKTDVELARLRAAAAADSPAQFVGTIDGVAQELRHGADDVDTITRTMRTASKL